MLEALGSQSMVPIPAALTTPENLLEMLILGQSQETYQETLGVGSNNLFLPLLQIILMHAQIGEPLF